LARAFVVPVRFSARSHSAQATTIALAVDCAFIRCLVPPPVGDKVTLQLYLPEGGALQVTGLVRERSSRPVGFWVAFDKDLKAQARLSRALAAVPEEGGQERRVLRRYPVKLVVRFGTLDQLRKEHATNISAGGMFIKTDQPPPMDATVQVTIDLPGGGRPVEAKATVVHRVTPEEARARGVEPGVGVQFVESDDRFRERIDEIIASAAKGAG
jgi:uncharacterized protein (TIGR02266 family)